MLILALFTLVSFMPSLASALPRGTARPSQHLSPDSPPVCPLSFRYYNSTSGLCQYQCDQGFFPSSDQKGHRCSPCHPQCRTCTGQTQYQCSSCQGDGLGLVVIEGQCACPSGMVQQTPEESCLRCGDIFPDCLNCNKTGCLTCRQGYFVNQTSSRCSPCSEGCIACSSGSECVTCNHRYTRIRGNCLQLPSSNTTSSRRLSSCSTIFPNCMVCDRKCFAINPPGGNGGGCPSHQSNLAYCRQCDATYYVAANEFSCQPCSSHCYACTSGSVCTTCLATFIKVTSGSSVTCGCNTAGQYFYDSATGKCKTCTYFKSHCQTCSLSGSTVVCSTCSSGYALAAGVCQPCPINCVSCAPTTLLCTTCSSGYASVSGVCQLCPTNCTSCAATTLLCITCVNPSYTLNSGVCSCDQTTGAASTFLAPSGACLACSTLQPNCVDCSYDASFSVYCSACSPNYKVDSGSCVCDDTNNYFLDVSANICRHCGDFIYGCTTCVFNNISQLIDCSVPDSSHLLSWSGTQMVCLACLPNCASCSVSPSTCDSCLPNFSSSTGTLCDICDLCGCPDPTCVTCNSFPNSNECLSCMPGYYYDNVTSCIVCPSGCLLCGSNDPTCLICQDGFMLNGSTCVCNTILGYFLDTGLGNCQPCSFFATNCKACFDNAGTIQCSSCNDGFYPTSPTTCDACGSHCLTCTSPALCTLCQNTYSNPYGSCICDDVTLFYDSGSDLCQACSFFDPICLTCSTPPLDCSLCPLYYYVGSASAPFCTPCPIYCQNCTVSACITCDTGYLWSSTYSNCSCDEGSQYFINTTNSPSTCQLCSLSYCLNCSSLETCIECDIGYFIDPATQWCRQTICGDGLVSGSQQCDDGGASGGCVDCKTQSGYVASYNSFLVGSCVLSSSYSVVLQSITVSTALCDIITLAFSLSGFDAYLSSIDFSSIVILPFEFALKLNSSSLSSKILQLTYNYFSNYEQKNITFFFLFSSVSPALPDIEVLVHVQADNNVKAMYYTQEECASRDLTQQVVQYTEYATYGVLLISALPAKIVGLEAIGVLQLAYLTLGSLDGINLMMTPLLGLKDSSGYTFSGIVQQEEVPTRIKGISYDAAFLNNCNLMMAVLGAEIIVALIFFGLAQIVVMYSATLSSIGSRLIKEGLLTLLLFNAFNLSYSAALHLHYSPETQQLRTYSTLLAGAGLGVAVVMCVGITMAGEQGFGEYKDKFKSDALSKGYLTATLVYRMALGYYMASQNQDELSTLMVLAFSIGFLLYNLVNLPFNKAYHNYRANLCHLTQFATLMVATYYRSMKSTAPLDETYNIYQPAYLQLGLIVTCVGVSALVGLYDLYLFVKEKVQSCSKGEEKKIESAEGGKVQQQSLDTLQAQQFT